MVVRREGGQAGGNSVPFVGKVSGHLCKYEEGGEADVRRRVKCHWIRDLKFQENKVTDGEYMRVLEGYCVLTDDSLRSFLGGGGVFFYHDAPHFQVELYQLHRTNMASFQLDPSGQQ